ncbi:hypothetical protein [Methylicorpusculum sp.]|nr:hypothetical protein [Methylicorpusculum sp.]
MALLAGLDAGSGSGSSNQAQTLTLIGCWKEVASDLGQTRLLVTGLGL